MSDVEIERGIDLTNCDREPIHIPGAILPHGAMLALNPETLVIEQTAGDCERLIGLGCEALLGRSLASLLGAGQLQMLRGLIQASDLRRPRHLLDPVMRVLPARPLDASLHKAGGVLVIEFEDADLEDRHAVDPLTCVQEMIDGLDHAPTLQDFCQIAADHVRNVARYDRVMIYRFMPDDSGWVFAESRREDLVPFLDLHYPASDIPKQARALYLTSPIRLITQVNYDPAPLLPQENPRTGRMLDMSHATLRDVSPIHREYLRNMGVDASMSISITREGKLWGLIACHNYAPRRLPRHLRAICELFGSIFSLQLEARQRAELFEARLGSRKVLSTIMHQLAQQDDYAVGLIEQAQNLLDYISAGELATRAAQSPGGLTIRVNGGIASIGQTPNNDAIALLTDWLTQRTTASDGVFVTDRLGDLWAPAKDFAGIASGLLAISVSREPRDFVLWFRPEIVQTVSWGGDPTKPIEIGPNGTRLTPRKSFESWSETVRGRSAPWSDSDRDSAFDLRVSLLEIVLRRIDSAARERMRAFEHERLLMAELDHRVKNTLANIQALVMQTSHSAQSLTDFTEGLERRIRAMSRAHSLLTQTRWEGVSIASLAREELAAYSRGHANILQTGPEVVLKPKAALALSLALHELATNAAKYGALSVPHGRLDLAWQTVEGTLQIRWCERGGPLVRPPTRRGFGSTLIGRALQLETGGTSRTDYLPEGVVCDITLPAEAIAKLEPAPAASAAYPPADTVAVHKGGPRRILVVEDSALVVMLIEDVFEDLGWELVGPASRLGIACEMAAHETYDAALLDINLDGEMSWDVAAIVEARGIPFAFSTGYDGAAVLPKRFRNAAIISKPFQIDDLTSLLREMAE